jgi:hypothetical protein
MSLSLISIPVQSQPLDQLTLPPLSTPPMVQLTLPPLVPPPVEQEVKPITEKPNNLIISEKIIFSQEFSSNVFLIRAINKNTWQEEKLFTTLPDQQNKTVTMWEPSWAPDGKKAAYVLWYITGEIYLMSLDDQPPLASLITILMIKIRLGHPMEHRLLFLPTGMTIMKYT